MQETGVAEVLDVKGACELLLIKDRTLRKWVKERGLPHSRIGGVLRFRRSSLVEWVASFEKSTPGGFANG